MKKLFKLLLILAVLAGLGLGALFWKLDSLVDAFKPRLEEQLSRDLGSPTTIGKIIASVFPQPGFEISGVEIKGSSGTSLRSAAIHADLMSLLQGKIVFSNITLDGARVTLVKAKDGKLLISGIKPKSAERAQGTDKPAAEGGSEGAKQDKPAESGKKSEDKKDLDLEIREISIKDSFLTVSDESVAPIQKLTIAEINGSLRDINPKGAAKGSLRASIQGAAAAEVTLGGDFGNPVAGFPLDLKLQIHNVQLEPLVSLLHAYGVNTAGIKLSKAVHLSGSSRAVPGAIEYQGELEGTEAGIEFAKFFSKPAGKKLTVDTKFRVGIAKTVTADEFNLKLGSINIELPFAVSPNGATTAKLKTSDLSLAELTSFVPMLAPYQLAGDISAQLETDVTEPINGSVDVKSKGTLRLTGVSAALDATSQEEHSGGLKVDKLTGSVTFEGDDIRIETLTGELAGQPLNVEGKIVNLSNPTVALVVKSQEIRAEPILKALKNENPSLSASFLRDVNIAASYRSAEQDGSVKLTSGKAQIADVSMDSVAANIDITPGRIVLQPSTLGLFGGSLTTEAAYSRGENKAFSVGLKGSAMDAAKLSSVALKDSSVKIRGTLSSIGASLSGVAPNASSSLSGSVRATFNNGAITGVNILAQTLGKLTNIPGFGQALSAYIPPQYLPLMQSDETPFETLITNADISGGRINLTPVDLKHAAYEVNGTGWTAFNGEMEIHGKLKITKQMATQMTLKEAKLKLLLDPDGGLVVPILISKRDGNVIVIPDIEDLLKRAARNTATEALGRELEKVAPGLGGAAKALDSLFK